MHRIPENQYTFFDSGDLSQIYNDFRNRRLVLFLLVWRLVLEFHRQRFDIRRQILEEYANEAGLAAPVALVEFVSTDNRLMFPGYLRLFAFDRVEVQIRDRLN